MIIIYITKSDNAILELLEYLNSNNYTINSSYDKMNNFINSLNNEYLILNEEKKLLYKMDNKYLNDLDMIKFEKYDNARIFLRLLKLRQLFR